jgi:hypothetical protein
LEAVFSRAELDEAVEDLVAFDADLTFLENRRAVLEVALVELVFG